MCWWLFLNTTMSQNHSLTRFHLCCDTPTNWKQTSQKTFKTLQSVCVWERSFYSAEKLLKSFFTLHITRFIAVELYTKKKRHDLRLSVWESGVHMHVLWRISPERAIVVWKRLGGSIHNNLIRWSAAILNIFQVEGQSCRVNSFISSSGVM